MGFLEPSALLALPLAVLPLLLAWRGRRTGEPLRFSSIYLLERARRSPSRWRPTRARWLLILRVLAILLLVLAAARPVGPGGGEPTAHYPTRAIVAVDVSASAAQTREGRSAWTWIHARADSLLAWAGPDDEVALAAVADGVVGWWDAPPAALRARLADLAPTSRPSDWAAAIAALGTRLEEGTEAYLLTDGSRGAGPPAAANASGPEPLPQGHRVVLTWEGSGEPNRALVGASRTDPGTVLLAGRSWGPGAPASAVAGRRIGRRLLEARPIALDGVPATEWAAGDTATFALRGADPLAADDRLYVAAGAADAYRIARWAPADEPPEPGTLFWAAALAALRPGTEVVRAATLSALARGSPDLALLPIRDYRPDEVELLAGLAAAGARLLFAPACADPACVPEGGWLGGAAIAAPSLAWRLPPPDRRTTLAPRPGSAAGRVPEPLLARVPVRGALALRGGPPADWTWDLATGESALWVRGPVAVWLLPLGPPVTRLGASPVFPLVADAALAAWDPAWRSGATSVVAGRPLPLPTGTGGATVTGPLREGATPTTWDVPHGGTAPRPEEPGLYRIAPRGVPPDAEGANFVAVNGAPDEGDLTPVPAEAWRRVWGRPAAPADEWRGLVYPRRRGPELWPWALALALAVLAGEALVRRAPSNN